MNDTPGSIIDNDAASANYRQIFEESPAPMYIFDIHTFEFLAVNTAALNQYGYTRDEFFSMNATQIRPQEDIGPLKQTLKDVHTATYFDYGCWKHIRKNGEVIFVHIYAHSTVFQGKKARFVLAIDIDNKVKAEKALLEKNEQLKKISWTQSHELRGPLSSIMGLVKIFNKEDTSDPHNKEIIALITDAAEKLDAVVKKITNQACQ